jgi:small subunit ribosomal protein S3
MGQKIDPRGFRLVVTKDWSSRWFAHSNNFAKLLQEDIKIREILTKKFGRRASIGRILIERPAKSVKVTLFTARPGVIIGKKGEGIEQIKQELQKIASVPLHLNVEEIRKPELNAHIVADQIAIQLEKRIAFRRAMKRAMQTSMKMGAIGIKIETSGRLNGIEIARSEWYREGRVPLHTLRANVDYSTAEALTTYGIIGIKVWIYKGDLNLAQNKFVRSETSTEEKKRPARRAAASGDKPAPAKKPAAPRKRKVGTEDVAAK